MLIAGRGKWLGVTCEIPEAHPEGLLGEGVATPGVGRQCNCVSVRAFSKESRTRGGFPSSEYRLQLLLQILSVGDGMIVTELDTS